MSMRLHLSMDAGLATQALVRLLAAFRPVRRASASVSRWFAGKCEPGPISSQSAAISERIAIANIHTVLKVAEMQVAR